MLFANYKYIIINFKTNENQELPDKLFTNEHCRKILYIFQLLSTFKI